MKSCRKVAEQLVARPIHEPFQFCSQPNYSSWWLGILLALISSNLVNHVPRCKQQQGSGWDGPFKVTHFSVWIACRLETKIPDAQRSRMTRNRRKQARSCYVLDIRTGLEFQTSNEFSCNYSNSFNTIFPSSHRLCGRLVVRNVSLSITMFPFNVQCRYIRALKETLSLRNQSL